MGYGYSEGMVKGKLNLGYLASSARGMGIWELGRHDHDGHTKLVSNFFSPPIPPNIRDNINNNNLDTHNSKRATMDIRFINSTLFADFSIREHSGGSERISI